MGLFGKKKKEEIKPEELGYGFPATEKRKQVEGVTALGPEDMPPALPTAIFQRFRRFIAGAANMRSIGLVAHFSTRRPRRGARRIGGTKILKL